MRDKRTGGTEKPSVDVGIELQSLGLHCVNGSKWCVFSLQHLKPNLYNVNQATINPHQNPLQDQIIFTNPGVISDLSKAWGYDNTTSAQVLWTNQC